MLTTEIAVDTVDWTKRERLCSQSVRWLDSLLGSTRTPQVPAYSRLLTLSNLTDAEKRNPNEV